MNLAYLDLFNHVELNENTVNVLVIENKKLFREMIQQFMQSLLGLESKWVLSDKGKLVSLNKVAILVNDPLNLDMNERKLLDGLYNEMASIGMSDVHYMDTIQIQNALQAYINNVIHDVDFPFLESGDMSLTNLFKLASVHFEDYSSEPLEKISNYCSLCSRFKKCRLIVFVNLKTYFSDEELKEFYKDMAYKKISLLLVENREFCELDNEITTTIDSDLCIVKC